MTDEELSLCAGHDEPQDTVQSTESCDLVNGQRQVDKQSEGREVNEGKRMKGEGVRN
jgi:hypothetical protein